MRTPREGHHPGRGCREARQGHSQDQPKQPTTNFRLNVSQFFCARVNFHLEVNNPEECTTMENEFAEEIKKRGEDFKYFKDQVNVESQTEDLLYQHQY